MKLAAKLGAAFVVAAIIGFCGTAHAVIVGGNVVDGANYNLGSGDVAGVVPHANWNNITYGSTGLLDSTGNATGVAFDYISDDTSWGPAYGNDGGGSGTPNQNIMGGYTSGGSNHLVDRISGLGSINGGTNDIYIYSRVALTTYDGYSATNGSWTPFSSSTAFQDGFYSLVSGWTSPNFYIRLGNFGGAANAAFQVGSLPMGGGGGGGVPEPSTCVLVALGCLTFVGRSRRRRT